MVIKVKVNHKKILFLGDTGTESSEKLIKGQGNNLKADIVQMAHHGQAGATEELYKIVKPEICLWPTPEWLWNNNSFFKGRFNRSKYTNSCSMLYHRYKPWYILRKPDAKTAFRIKSN